MAFLMAAGINASTAAHGGVGPTATAMGNMVLITPADSGCCVMTAGMFSGIIGGWSAGGPRGSLPVTKEVKS